MLTIKPSIGESVRCPLLMEGEKAAPCGFMQGVKSGMLSSFFRIVAKDGDRIELGVRSKFAPNPLLEGGKRFSTMSMSIEDVKNLPETRYWFEPGQKLEIKVAGFGTIILSGELLDHMPSIVSSGDEQLDPKQDEFRVISPVLLRGKELVLEFEGFIFSDDKGNGVFMYTPTEGRYVLSLSPLEGAVEGQIRQSRVHFEMNGEAYMFLMAAPIARTERIWILHEPNYRPSREMPGAPDDQAFIGNTDLSHFLAKPPAKN